MNTFRGLTIATVILLSSGTVLKAQTDLLNMLDSVAPKTTQYTYGTFKSTRVINGHSTERMPERQLDFRISHRFGLVNQGYSQFFGLDQGSMLISLEYGVKDWVMLGLNRTTYEKTVSGFSKFSILRQSSGVINMPLSLSYLASISANGLPLPNSNYSFNSRLTYVHQLLIARKFNEQFSFQLSPTFLHRNLVPTASDHNDLFALGFAGRYKLSRRTSFNVEYYPVFGSRNYADPAYTNSFSMGFDIETGGHVFQLMLSNSVGMIEKAFIGETTGNWLKGDIHLGFNISRVFSFK